jgi:hypothetical protein
MESYDIRWITVVIPGLLVISNHGLERVMDVEWGDNKQKLRFTQP